METKKINEVLYERRGGFFIAWKDNKNSYDIVCECGNNKFTLKYGCYEITATCSECGNSQVVYDG